MSMLWRFSINGTQVEEPIGWDQVQITLSRSDNFHGLENVYSDTITFWGQGADIVLAAYEADGVDAVLQYLIEYSCDNGVSYKTWIDGILNCMFFSVVNREVSIKIEPIGFQRLFKNRLDTPVNLMSNISTGGMPMSDINPFDLFLHSKGILSKGNFILDTFASDYTEIGVSDAQTNFLYIPMQTDIDEFGTLNDITTLFELDQTVPHTVQYVFNTPVDGEYTFDYNFQGSILETTAGTRSFDHRLNYTVGNPASTPDISIGPLTSYTQTGGTILVPFNSIGTLVLTLSKDDKVAFYHRIFNSTPNRSADIRMITTSAKLNISSVNVFNPSISKAFLIHEVFAKVCESITDTTDCFRSTFFGRTNSQPNQYDGDGCAAWTAITNGLNIRKMLDANDNLFPINTTFNDLFQACDAVWNLGMRVESDDTGKEYIRVEPKEFFYNGKAILTTLNVSDLKRSPASDVMYNNYQVGYEKWNLNITGSNALDEFNSIHNYTLPLSMVMKQLVTTSKFIASGYVIEQTRRLQYNSVPTNDFETDNNLFFICTNIDTVTSDKYTTPPVLTIYPAGTVSERDENFTSITNVLSPSTVYNYRISPVRMGLNWYKYLAASLYKKTSPVIKFVSGQGNYLEGDMMVNGCTDSATVLQNQDIQSSDLIGEGALPLFDAEYLEFTYPLSMDDFINIMNNSEKAIQVSCNGQSTIIGFIKQLQYSPNSEDATMASFKLLRGQCILGDFNSDFSDDFYTGNCV